MRPITQDATELSQQCISNPVSCHPVEWDRLQTLGEGSNNKAYRVIVGGKECALRVPRKNSDTQDRCNTICELYHTLKAQSIGAAPEVYKAWFVRHAFDGHRAGLYMLSEVFEGTLADVMYEADDEATRCASEATAACLRLLADHHIFAFDLAPTNFVVKNREGGGLDAKMIDFGKDFCQSASQPYEVSTLLTYAAAQCDGDAHLSHILYSAMLVLAASILTFRLRMDRRVHKKTEAERRSCNGLAALAKEHLAKMRGKDVAILRQLLRRSDVRGVLRHYHGRRNGGTRRTLLLARGEEAFSAATPA